VDETTTLTTNLKTKIKGERPKNTPQKQKQKGQARHDVENHKFTQSQETKDTKANPRKKKKGGGKRVVCRRTPKNLKVEEN